jgi:hypothetical protein
MGDKDLDQQAPLAAVEDNIRLKSGEGHFDLGSVEFEDAPRALDDPIITLAIVDHRQGQPELTIQDLFRKLMQRGLERSGAWCRRVMLKVMLLPVAFVRNQPAAAARTDARASEAAVDGADMDDRTVGLLTEWQQHVSVAGASRSTWAGPRPRRHRRSAHRRLKGSVRRHGR